MTGSQKEKAPGAVAQLLLAWWPLGVVLVAYAVAQWINSPLGGRLEQGAPNALGFPLHISEPGVADRALFGTLPSAWLQDRLYTPAQAHWWDAPLALVYVSHFVAIPLAVAVLWFRRSDRFRRCLWAVLVTTGVGIVTYVVYPMAPPWLAAQLGHVEPVARISGIGWQALELPWVGGLLGSSQAASNPVAAMPSLHAGSAALVLLLFWSVARWWGRCLLAVYAALMAFTLVYTGEHYVVDVLGGWSAAAIGAIVGWWLVTAAAPRPRQASDDSGRTSDLVK